MKALKLLSSILIFALFFSSCNHRSGISITKRHYNKGYYIAHKSSAGKVTQKEPLASNKSSVAPIQSQRSTPAASPLINEKTLTASNEKTVKQTTLKKTHQLHRSVHFTPVQNNQYTKIESRLKKSLGLKSGSMRSGDDALSLLWIVILIILALYVLALLTGGWGLGGLIHVLAVVALVLLILWLLKVI